MHTRGICLYNAGRKTEAEKKHIDQHVSSINSSPEYHRYSRNQKLINMQLLTILIVAMATAPGLAAPSKTDGALFVRVPGVVPVEFQKREAEW
jgi:hypothetical protein